MGMYQIEYEVDHLTHMQNFLEVIEEMLNDPLSLYGEGLGMHEESDPSLTKVEYESIVFSALGNILLLGYVPLNWYGIYVEDPV